MNYIVRTIRYSPTPNFSFIINCTVLWCMFHACIYIPDVNHPFINQVNHTPKSKGTCSR